MKRAALSYVPVPETEQRAPASEKARVRKVPQLSKGQQALHKGTGKGAFSLEKALNLYTPKAAK